MITYSFGDIVLIGCPYTDMKGISKRPALILFDSGDQDILVSRITTQKYTTKTDYKIIRWKESGLLAESYIRKVCFRYDYVPLEFRVPACGC